MLRFFKILFIIIFSAGTVRAAIDDSTKNALSELEKTYNDNINKDTYVAMEAAAQGKQLAQEAGDTAYIALMNKYLGKCYFKNCVYYLAMESQFAAYEGFLRLNNKKEIADCLVDIAETYSAQEVYDMAEEYAQKSYEICKNSDFPEQRAAALRMLGIIRININEEEALNNLIQAKSILDSLGHADLSVDINLHIAQTYMLLDQPDNALSILNGNLEEYVKQNDFYNIARTYAAFGRTYTYIEQFEKAELYYKQAEKIYIDNSLFRETAQTQYLLAGLYYQNDNYNPAEEYAAKCLSLAQTIEDLKLKYSSCDILYKVYKKSNRISEALLFCERVKILADSIYAEKKKEQFSEFQVSMESQKQQKEIEMLQVSAEKDRLMSASKQYRRNIIFFVVICILIIGVVVIYYFRYKEKAKNNKLLQDSNARMQLEIQERKLAEAEVRNSEEKYRLLFRKTPVGIIQFDDGFNITTVNDRFIHIFNIENSNLVGKSINSILPAEIFRGFDAEKDDNGRMQKQERKIETIGGDVYVSITLKSYSYNSGREVEKGGIMIVEDITERKKAEMASIGGNSLGGRILKLLPDLFFILNKNADYIEAVIPRNPELQNTYKGKNIREMLPADLLLPFLVAFNNVKKTGKTQYVEYKTAEKNEFGNPVYNEARFFADGDNVLLSIRDISRQKETENDLKTAKANAESGSKAKSRFLLDMAQDIKLPLEKIIEKSKYLSGLNNAPELNAKIKEIEDDTREVFDNLSDILNLTKIEADKSQLYLKTANPVKLAKEIFDIFKEKAEEKNLDYEFEAENNIPHQLEFDEVRLRQVLFNIVGNGVKFTQKGRVKVIVGKTTVDPMHIDLIFKVSDTGVGLTENQRNSLFEKQDSPEHKNGAVKNMSGTREILESINGKISVMSELGKGSTFTITLPGLEADADFAVETELVDTDILQSSEKAVNTTRKKKVDAEKEFFKAVKETFVPKFIGLKQSISFEILYHYADEYEKLASAYNIEKSVTLAQNLKRNVKNFDISKINNTLKDFEKEIFNNN